MTQHKTAPTKQGSNLLMPSWVAAVVGKLLRFQKGHSRAFPWFTWQKLQS
jgi:hypothetical protein